MFAEVFISRVNMAYIFLIQDPKISSHVGQIPGTGVLAGQSVPIAALATVAPILPFGVTTLRDDSKDSTESDQSLIGSQPQSEAFQRFL